MRRRCLTLWASFAAVALKTPSVFCLQIEKAKSRVSPPEVWRTAEIDFSAANEYVRAHYSQMYDGSHPYFSHSGRAMQPIHDARRGVYVDETNALNEASLESCGFALCAAPTAVTDWTDMDQIRTVYLPELRKILSTAFGDSGERISHVVFWHPMLRGEGCAMSGPDHDRERSPPTAPVAGLVHIDTDIGAHDADGLLRLIERNRIAEEGSPPFPRRDLAEALDSGRRFAVANAWRNADPLGRPVGRAPLAVLLPRYREGRRPCFPEAAPDERSRWYAFPGMRAEECLLFKQYDRRLGSTSDLWHCALPSSSGDEDASMPPRRSFDLRALVVFDEVVQSELDRFGPGRLRPVLSLRESGCFCNDQARKRGVPSSSAFEQDQ